MSTHPIALPDPSDLKAEVIRLCKAQPDEMRECQYVNEYGAPHCVVGQALFNLGVQTDVLALLRGSIDEVYGVVGKETDSDIYEDVTFLERVQFYQDTQHTWGEALERAGIHALA